MKLFLSSFSYNNFGLSFDSNGSSLDLAIMLHYSLAAFRGARSLFSSNKKDSKAITGEAEEEEEVPLVKDTPDCHSGCFTVFCDGKVMSFVVHWRRSRSL